MAHTKLEHMIDPEVMADMISAKIPEKIRVAPFAAVDNTLSGRPGSSITVPRFKYIGDADDIPEGGEITPVLMSTDKDEFTIKKVGKAVSLTDEAVLSGFGNPVGNATNQITLAIASKLDNDSLTALRGATMKYASAASISYAEIVKALDRFNEEINTPKVIFINPTQVTELRLDKEFISADKYDNKVMMTGEIGKIANVSVVPSRKVKLVDGAYQCPIVKLTEDKETEDELAAITIYLKRETMLETERLPKKGLTDVVANKHFVVALTDESKVVLASFKKAEDAAEPEGDELPPEA